MRWQVDRSSSPRLEYQRASVGSIVDGRSEEHWRTVEFVPSAGLRRDSWLHQAVPSATGRAA